MPDLLGAQHVHLVGIGGSGMSALASLLLQLGKTVSGSDVQSGAITQQLAEQGATIRAGHRAEHVAGADYVVRSSAVADDNVEVAQAKQSGLPVRKLAEAGGGVERGGGGGGVRGAHGQAHHT